MNRYRVLFQVATGINLLSPLLPVAAGLIHARMGRHQPFSGQNRLLILVVYGLVINWGMVGLSISHIHNAWLANPAYTFESLLMLWVLAAVGNGKLPRPVLLGSAAVMLIGAAWDARRIGLHGMWPVAETIAGILLTAACLWLLHDLLTGDKQIPAWQQPAFWLFSSWALMLATGLVFYPLRTLFLRRLSREWILAPWFAKYLIGLILNLGLARTFLCPKPSSS